VRGERYSGNVYLLNLPEPIRGLKVNTKSCRRNNVMQISIKNESEQPIYLKRHGPIACCIRVLSKEQPVSLIDTFDKKKARGFVGNKDSVCGDVNSIGSRVS